MHVIYFTNSGWASHWMGILFSTAFVPTISADFGTPTADSPLGAYLAQWVLFHTLHSSKVYRLVQGLRVSRAREVRGFFKNITRFLNTKIDF